MVGESKTDFFYPPREGSWLRQRFCWHSDTEGRQFHDLAMRKDGTVVMWNLYVKWCMRCGRRFVDSSSEESPNRVDRER